MERGSSLWFCNLWFVKGRQGTGWMMAEVSKKNFKRERSSDSSNFCADVSTKGRRQQDWGKYWMKQTRTFQRLNVIILVKQTPSSGFWYFWYFCSKFEAFEMKWSKLQNDPFFVDFFCVSKIDDFETHNLLIIVGLNGSLAFRSHYC